MNSMMMMLFHLLIGLLGLRTTLKKQYRYDSKNRKSLTFA